MAETMKDAETSEDGLLDGGWVCDECDAVRPDGSTEIWLGKSRCFCSVQCLEDYISQH